jgi:hypothetical protein
MGMIFLMGMRTTVLLLVIGTMNMIAIMMMIMWLSFVTTGIGGWVHIDVLDITSALVL